MQRLRRRRGQTHRRLDRRRQPHLRDLVVRVALRSKILDAQLVCLYHAAFPLDLHDEREGSVIETDKLRIKDFRAQGYTDNQISQMGLSASVEPAVGLAAPAASKPLHLQQ